MWGGGPTAHWVWKHVVYAARRIGQKPGFTLIAVSSLALGIGANTAIFSLVNAILIRKAPIEKPEELVEIYISSPEFEYNVFSLSRLSGSRRGDERGLRRRFGHEAEPRPRREGYRYRGAPGRGGDGKLFSHARYSRRPRRTILPEDDVAPGAHAVAMLGHAYWEKAFGSDPHVVGREIRLGGRPYTIIGVAPRDYEGYFRGIPPAVFVPHMMVNEVEANSYDDLETRGNHSVFVQARLRPGVSLARAQTALDAVSTRLRDDHIEDWNPRAAFLMVPATDVILYPPFDRFIRTAAWLLMVIVGLVLLMACVNLASFLLARALDAKRSRSAPPSGRADLTWWDSSSSRPSRSRSWEASPACSSERASSRSSFRRICRCRFP